MRSPLLGCLHPSTLALLGLVLAAGCGSDDAPPRVYAPTAKLMVFSDPHYFSPTLGPIGAAFEDYLAQDRKMLAESDAIMQALVSLVASNQAEIVLVAGDLTKDGERASHEGAAAYFRQMEAAGSRVFVVPGNHDIQNANAQSYTGDSATDVATVSAAELASIYADAGFGESLERDPGSLSYVAELVPGLWLLAIDSCIYGDARGSSTTAGRLLDGTKAWIKTQLAEAKQRGIRVVAMMHHGLVEHFGNQTLLFGEYVIADRAAVASLLSEGGVGAIFTGHFHANDITQYTVPGQTRSIYDIETGSAITAPCPYRIVELSSDVLNITSGHIPAIPLDLRGAPDFQTYARDSLRSGLESLLPKLIEAPPYSLPADRATAIAPWLMAGLMAHYQGDEVMPAEARVESQSLLATPNLVEALAGAMLQSIWTDLPAADNQVTIDLAAGN